MGILRSATVADLHAINSVVAAAVCTWHLPERVLRLALPSLLHRENDFAHMAGVVAGDGDDASSVADWPRTVGELDWLINAAGVLHTENHRRAVPRIF